MYKRQICVPRDKAVEALEDGAQLGPCGSNPCILPPITPVNYDALVGGFGNLTQGSANIYPNPASDQCTLEFYMDEDVDMSISLIDLSGRKVLDKNISTSKGVNNVKLETGHLGSGVYVVHVTSDQFQWYKQLVLATD